MKFVKILVCMVIILGFSAIAYADVPKMINYQGKITRPSGALVDTTTTMVFSIYADSTGGSPLWTETQTAVDVQYGVFSVLLGSVNPIPDSVFDGNMRYLGVKVGDDSEMTPRKAIVSVGYAYHSGTADTAYFAMPDVDWTIDGENIYRLSGNVGIGTNQPVAKLHIAGGGIALDDQQEIAWQNNQHNAYYTVIKYGVGNGNHLGLYSNGDEKVRILNTGNVGIGTTNPQYKLDVEGYVQAYGYYTGDIVFQKDKEKLWRMYEDEDGLYLENLKTGKVYRFVLQEMEKE